ncbi:Ham1-like protein [Ostreococcus tauri]|uniref:Ham1-like protein n=1 Tax=Ostreococcus tauri TaxID=70448 RepID=A0A090N3R0_OSTTA|nr:Ham1-like protein [Ostreococcus tauri]CEF98553.1 Ham1-like protein [Ostreococcus tauri]|eukprot:XP_022839332.1 Ham1-like protein [Ostreococcus tauri]
MARAPTGERAADEGERARITRIANVVCDEGTEDDIARAFALAEQTVNATKRATSPPRSVLYGLVGVRTIDIQGSTEDVLKFRLSQAINVLRESAVVREDGDKGGGAATSIYEHLLEGLSGDPDYVAVGLDTLEIHSIGDYPGPLTRHANAQLGPDRLWDVASRFLDRRATMACTVAAAHVQSGEVSFFRGELEGEIVPPKDGATTDERDFRRIFQPKGSARTLVELSFEERVKTSAQRRAIEQFVAFIASEGSIDTVRPSEREPVRGLSNDKDTSPSELSEGEGRVEDVTPLDALLLSHKSSQERKKCAKPAIARSNARTDDVAKKPRGRPQGSTTKVIQDGREKELTNRVAAERASARTDDVAKKPRGRPQGSTMKVIQDGREKELTNRVAAERASARTDDVAKKPRGRPQGSTTKKPRGRPKGGTNTVFPSTNVKSAPVARSPPRFPGIPPNERKETSKRGANVTGQDFAHTDLTPEAKSSVARQSSSGTHALDILSRKLKTKSLKFEFNFRTIPSVV